MRKRVVNALLSLVEAFNALLGLEITDVAAALLQKMPDRALHAAVVVVEHTVHRAGEQGVVYHHNGNRARRVHKFLQVRHRGLGNIRTQKDDAVAFVQDIRHLAVQGLVCIEIANRGLIAGGCCSGFYTAQHNAGEGGMLADANDGVHIDEIADRLLFGWDAVVFRQGIVQLPRHFNDLLSCFFADAGLAVQGQRNSRRGKV